MDKNLTVIIPTYNMEKYLDICLTSLIINDKVLLEQLEILVIIDGAKDRSSEIAHDYESKYPDIIRVIDKENGNYGSCINRGLKEAKGRYVKVIDSDDSVDSCGFRKLLKCLCAYNTDVIISNYEIVNEEGIVKTKHVRQLHEGIIDAEMVLKQFAVDILAMHEITYRTDLLREINYIQTERISYTDQEWVYLPICKARSFAYCDAMVYKYLIGREGQSVSQNALLKSSAQIIKICDKMLDVFSEHAKHLSEAQIYYANSRIYFNLKDLYYNQLVLRPDILDARDLYPLENKLKYVTPQLYNYLETYGVHRFLNGLRVRKWRRSKAYPSLSFTFKLENYVIHLLYALKKV